MAERVPMTPLGQQKLRERLKQLKSVERPKIIEAIEVARAHGDLSENAEYSAAKEAQQHLMAEMEDIETKLAYAHVIDPKTIDSDKIAFGATVKFADEDGNENSYQIVGADESNVNEGKISILSPIARALIGKQEGDEAKIKTPRGDKFVEIVSIEYK